MSAWQTLSATIAAVFVATVSTAAILLGVNIVQIRAIETGRVNLFASARWIGGVFAFSLMPLSLFYFDTILRIEGLAPLALALVAAGPPVHFTSRATGTVGTWTTARECFLFYEDTGGHWTDGWGEWLSGERPEGWGAARDSE